MFFRDLPFIDKLFLKQVVKKRKKSDVKYFEEAYLNVHCKGFILHLHFRERDVSFVMMQPLIRNSLEFFLPS
jgi:hypothetical protein